MNENYKKLNSILSLKKFLFISFFFLINYSFGQGTTCALAELIAINGCDPGGTATINDNTQNTPNIATTPTSTSCPTGTFRREGWYTFTVTGGPLAINISATSTTATSNLYLQLIASSDNTCSGTLSQIDCANNVNTNGAQTENIYVTLSNGTYWVKVVNVATGGGGMGLSSFCITNPPANDFCNYASSLTVNPSTTCTSSSNGTTVGATQSLAGCSGTADDDVWYSFVATSTNHTITVTPTTMTDAVFQVFSGICSGLTSLVCTNSTTGSSAETSTISGLSIGTTYYVRVHSNGNGSGQGTFNICVTTPSAPSNNNCSGSTALTVNPSTTCTTSTSGTTFGATQSQSGCSGSADDDVWYSFVATNTLHTITATPTTLSDIVFETFSGSCGGLVSLGCVNATSGTSAETTTVSGLTIGNTYYVRVYSASNYTGAGTFSVCVTTPPTPPTNNQCSAATSLPCGTTNLAGTTVNTINYAHGTGCTMSDYGVWYTFTGDGQQTTISSTAGAGFDHEMAIASGSCGSLTNITCQDLTTSGGTETYTFNTVNGTTYYVYIAYWTSGTTTGTFTISRSCSVTAANNECTGAVSLTVNSGTACTTSTNGTTVAATQSMAGCYGTADDDVWYSFVATSTSHTITVTPNTLSDVVFQVFSGNCAGLTGLGCIDSTSGTSAESTTLSTLTIGNTYYVRVYSYSNGASQGTFNICVTTPTNPCSSITNIATCNTTINATVPAVGGIMGTSSCGWTTPGYEMIYSFTPTVTGAYYITQNSSYSYIDYQYKVASGGCGTTGWTCIDDMFGLTTSPNITLTAGVQYYIMLDPESSAGGNVNFTLNCPLAPPVNDDCAGAIPLSVNNSCAYTIYSNAGATNSTGAPAPGCGGYSGGDVWFSITVPPSGILKIDSTSAVMTDGGMAAYTGTCGSLTLLQCNDDRGSFDYMPYMNLYGLTPGSTIYIRFWENGNNNNGTFGLCVTTCSPGTSTGSSSAGCPIVVAGGLGLNGSDPNPVNACSGTTCVDLEANYLHLGQTTNYTVTSIPYANLPYQFGCLSNAVSVNVDDVWSPVINLPFNFCFFGSTYSQCIMGSNGMLSFNVGNAGSGSGYSFSNNLPSTTGALFANTIYGVYHDIDPSKGGEVGWELITLKTGCRALVASWKDVPMFRTNTILYTGMMILYENTNIIEVYIQEKNIEFNGTDNWNGGNAIVGVQNAAGTTAVVPPGRNGLDTNWAITNEAWRFTPSGPNATTIKWYQGSGTSGPVIATTDNVNVCPVVTTTYTAEITYTYCNGTTETVTDETTVGVFGTKTWNGSVDSDWNKANNWTPSGIPTSTDCVIIPVTANNPIISGSGYNGLAGTLSVYNGATLTINSNNSLTVTSWVNVQATGNFIINNNSSLVQINGSANTGNITYKRNSSVRNQDFVYWASPVSGFNAGSISTPLNPSSIYTWNTTVANPNGGQGYWQAFSGAMIPGKGYIMRAPSSFSYSTPATWTATFNGVANNGTISVPIFRGSDTNVSPHYGTNGTQIDNYSDNWNLLGNPYPSAVRASQFLFDNRTKIMGNVRLWTHGTLPAAVSSPFYDTFVYNYSPGDYLTYNFTGASCCPAFGADLFIGSGQGFFVQMVDGPTGSNTISFNNNQRSYTYSNSSFYRFASSQNLSSDITNLERNRIWIDIVDSNNVSDRALVGYIEEATMLEDNFFDCVMNNTNNLAIYSLIDQQKYNIQGRALPFDDNDEVPIGFILPNGGNYNIALAGIDGLFHNQNIYIKDELTGIIHDIKDSPYQFTSENGEISNRFKIVYKDIALGNPDAPRVNQVSIISNNSLSVLSTQITIESVEVFNTLGQLIDTYRDINSTSVILSNIRKINSGLFLKIKLSNGQFLIKKTLF